MRGHERESRGHSGRHKPPLPSSELRERVHHLPRVRLDKACQRRHGAGHLLLGEKPHDANHREATVVDLDQQAALLCLGSRLSRLLANQPVEARAKDRLRRAKGLEEVEGRYRVGPAEPVADARLFAELLVVEGREVARLAALGVVRRRRELRPELEEADKGDDLPADVERRGIPLLGGVQGSG